MILLGPRPMILGQANIVLNQPIQPWTQLIPVGAPWRLLYLMVNYKRTVVARVQSTPDLSFTLYDSMGHAFQAAPVLAKQVTSPAGAPSIGSTNPINMSYPGGSTLRLSIEGQIIGTGPETVSVTFFGIRGWQRMGM